MTVIDKTFETLDEGRAWLQGLDMPGVARVRIVVSGEDVVDPARRFLENIDDIAVDTGVEDLAHNHDHYFYGRPKRP